MTRRRPDLTLPCPRLVSRSIAAAYLGISEGHFDAHVMVPPVKVGKRLLWDLRALDRWVDAASGLDDALPEPSIRGRLNGGDQGARR